MLLRHSPHCSELSKLYLYSQRKQLQTFACLPPIRSHKSALVLHFERFYTNWANWLSPINRIFFFFKWIYLNFPGFKTLNVNCSFWRKKRGKTLFYSWCSCVIVWLVIMMKQSFKAQNWNTCTKTNLCAVTHALCSHFNFPQDICLYYCIHYPKYY